MCSDVAVNTFLIASTYGSVANDVVVALASILALLTHIGIVAVIALRLAAFVSPAASRVYNNLSDRVAHMAIPLAFIVAGYSMANSLYFSLHIGWQPCVLCWYQRCAIFPLAVILGVATFLRRSTVAPYAAALAAVGAAISAYHYLIEWFPTLEASACQPTIPCTEVYFRSFGYISISLMALTCEIAVLVLLMLWRSGRRNRGTSVDSSEAHSPTGAAE